MSDRTGSPHKRHSSHTETPSRGGNRRLFLFGLGALGALLFLVLILALAPSASAQCLSSPRVFYVDDDYFIDNPLACQYKSITNLTLVGIQANDIINIANGSYTLNYNLSVDGTQWIGENQRSVFVNRSGTNPAPLAVRANNTRVTNMTFSGYDSGIDVDYTGPFQGTHRGNTLENLTLISPFMGCWCWGYNLTIMNISITTAGYGIYQWMGANLTVRNLSVTHSATYYESILIYTPNFDIRNVYVTGTYTYILDASGAFNGSVRDVRASGVMYGLLAGSSLHLTAQNISFDGVTDTAVYLYSDADIQLDGLNVVNGTNYGFRVYDSSSVTARNVAIDKATYGVYMYAAGGEADFRNLSVANGAQGIYAPGAAVNATGLTLSGFSSQAIWAGSGARVNITGAVIMNSSDAIYAASGSTVSMVLRNIVAANGAGHGLYIGGGTTNASGLTFMNFTSDAVQILGGARVTITGASINQTQNGVAVQGAATRLDATDIWVNQGSGCGLSISDAGANVTNLVATNFSLNPICGGGTSQLNVTGLVAVGGNDNIFWPGSRPLFVKDAVLGLPGNAGVYYQSNTLLTLLNVTVLSAPSYGVFCSPCGGITWIGGGVNDTVEGFYPQGSIPVTMSHLNFTNIQDAAVPLWWGAYSTASFDNITVVNASSGIYVYGAPSLYVADCVFVNIRSYGLYLAGSPYPRIHNNTWLNASAAFQWDPEWSPDSPNNYLDLPPTNTIDGKPIRYIANQSNYTLPLNSSILIAVNSSNITVSGFNGTAAYYGVTLVYSQNVAITQSTLVGYAGAVFALYTDNITVRDVVTYGHPNGWNPAVMAYYTDNLTVSNLTSVFLGSYSTGEAVNVQSATNVTISDIRGVNLSTTVFAWSATNAQISNISGINVTSIGFQTYYSTDVQVTNVSVVGGAYGVYIYSGTRVSVQRGTFLNTTSYGAYIYSGSFVNLTDIDILAPNGLGVWLRGGNNLTLTNVRVATNASAALNIQGVTDTTIHGSTFVSLNGSSTVVNGASTNLLLYNNNFYGGTISNTPASGTWDLGFPQGGNYYDWAVGGFTDEFTGVTKTTPGKDGLADQNYTINGAAKDYYPLMDPWPPGIILTSPANGAVIQAGTSINFTVSNFFDAVSWVDSFAGNGSALGYPHDIDTTGWPDGYHNITVTGTDAVAPAAVRTFSFILDSTPPAVTTTPLLGSPSVAQGARVNITVTDLHLEGTLFRIDGGPTIIGSPTYSVDTSGWVVGNHWILIVANDTAGNIFLYNWSFYIDGAAPTLSLFDPTGTTFVPPGVHFTYDAADEHLLANVTFVATPLNATTPRSGTLAANSTRYSFNTTGWDDGCYGVRVTATDEAGHSVEVAQDICVDGSHPDLSNIQPVYTGVEDQPFTFPGTDVQDLDWNPTFTWEFDPAIFQSLTTLTGRSPAFTFDTPAAYSVHLVVVDRAGNVASKDFLVSIADTTPPVAAFSLPGNAPEDQNLTLDAGASTDNDPSWSLSNASLFTWVVTGPSGTMTLNGSVVSVNLTQPGNHTVNLTVRDAAGHATTVSHLILVLDETPPTIVVDGIEPVINEGDTLYLDASGTTDNVPGPLTFVWSFVYASTPQSVAGAYLDFTFDTPGTYTITLSVTDQAGKIATMPIQLLVNDVPSLKNTPLTAVEGGQAYSWQIDLWDNDSTAHTFDLVDGPTGLTVSNSGLVQWSPAVSDAGVHRVQITVYDDYGYFDLVYVITVSRPPVEGNHAPAFTSFPVQSAAPGVAYSYAVRFADPDASDHLTLALGSGPDGMTLDGSDTLRWDVPSWYADGDQSQVSLVLSDGLITVYQNFTIRIRLANAAAQFVAGQIDSTLTVEVGKSVQIPLGPGVATDNDDPYADLSFFVVVASGNSVEASIQLIAGVPTLVVSGIAPGTSTLTLRVADPSGAGEELTITATVPAAPTAAGGDMTGLFLLVALVAAGAVGAFLIMRRRRPDEGGEVATSAPTVGAEPEEVQVEVVQEPAPAAKPAAPPVTAPAAAAIGVGAGAAAAAAARPMAPPVGAAKPTKGATYTIEGLFIIYQDGRMIFSKTDLGAEQLGDPELVSSMFTAVTQFIKDSFSAEGDLNKMGYGDNQIFIERGNHVYMAAIAFGEPDKELQEKMGTAIEKIEYSYAGVIESWDGQINRFSDIEKYVAPVLGLTAGITRGDVLAATTTREVKVLSQLEFFQGFVRLKVGVKNDTEAVVTKVTLDIDYNEDVLRLQRIEPASYKTSGARVMLNVLNPGEKSSVAFYFDPQICTETNIDGIVRFRDYKGVLQSVTMKTRKAEVVCPLFFTKEHANTAMLKRLIETELQERDSKVYTITKLPPYVKHKDIFEVCKQVVLSHDVHMVREFVTYNPFAGEAWFYGETKVKGYKIVIRTAVREDNTIEFFAASTVIKAVTGLLAEFNHTLIAMVVERYSDVKIEQIYDEGTKHEIQAKALVDKLGEGEASAGETDQ